MFYKPHDAIRRIAERYKGSDYASASSEVRVLFLSALYGAWIRNKIRVGSSKFGAFGFQLKRWVAETSSQKMLEGFWIGAQVEARKRARALQKLMAEKQLHLVKMLRNLRPCTHPVGL